MRSELQQCAFRIDALRIDHMLREEADEEHRAVLFDRKLLIRRNIQHGGAEAANVDTFAWLCYIEKNC